MKSGLHTKSHTQEHRPHYRRKCFGVTEFFLGYVSK